MRVLGDPLLHLDREPEGINAKGDNAQQEPLDEVAEKLTAVTVKGEALSVDDGMLDVPSFLQADGPRSTQAKGKGDDDSLQNADTDHSKKTACELRFHDVSSKMKILNLHEA